MKTLLLTLSLIFSLSACGGGSSGAPRSSIEGTWEGPLYQGGLFCSDGAFFGAGSGTIVKEVELIVVGSDELGSTVQAIDEDCYLEGPRTETGFTAIPVSGCKERLKEIEFTLIPDGSANLIYRSFDAVASEEGPTCVTHPYGTVIR